MITRNSIFVHLVVAHLFAQSLPFSRSDLLIMSFNKKNLSWSDTWRLDRLEAIYVSNQGKLLARSYKDETALSLVEPTGNGFIPRNAMLAAPYTDPVEIREISIWRSFFKFITPPVSVNQRATDLSKKLSEYLWLPDQDAIYVQFRSPVPGLPPHGQLKAVFSNIEGSSGGEFCLAACDDGTAKWLPQSECGNGAHVWTVHLFDSAFDGVLGEVNLCQRLRRRGPITHNNYVNVINNNDFGQNSNESGTQNVGTITAQTELNILLPPTNLEQRE